MRLLHVFPVFEVGGQQMRAVALANGMAQTRDTNGEGFHNLVLSLNGDLACAKKFTSEVSWEPVAAPGGHSLPGRLLAARKVLRSLRPDCLVTYNWGAIEWAAANSFGLCRHIHIEDGFGPEEAQGQLRRRALFRRLVLSHGSRVVFPSHTLYDIARDIWRLPEGRLSRIPNGIDMTGYGAISKADARTAFDLPQDKLIVGTLATLRPEKNLKRLLDAFQTVGAEVDCYLVIAGAGKEQGALEAYARELGLQDRVAFPGYIEKPCEILPAFDVFAISSDTEQMPLSVMEAMAAGLPVASLDVGDIRQMVAQDCQSFVQGRNVSALSQTLTSLLVSSGAKDLRARTGLANSEIAKDEFNSEKMLASWKNLFIYG